jgi:hypothetical protein
MKKSMVHPSYRKDEFITLDASTREGNQSIKELSTVVTAMIFSSAASHINKDAVA